MHAIIEAYEVVQDFCGLGQRTMLLNARGVFYEKKRHTTILLGIEDITERRANEREVKELLHQKDVLLQEIQHRVANSLQIIASILLLKARTVRSEETRLHLKDAHERIMSVAAIQQHLYGSTPGATIALGPYLSKLCETLATSIINNGRPISVKVNAEGCSVSSSHAVSIGLIVTELVINALKYAFPTGRSDCVVTVAYDLAEPNWTLTVADNGIGRPERHPDITKPGLGTTIIEALAKQLDARVNFQMNPTGMTVSITHVPIA